MILPLSLCTIWNIIIKQILEQNTCNFKRKFFKKNLVASRTLRNSRYHSLLWHLTVKKTVLGHFSQRKFVPNPILNPDSNPNLNPKWG